jgi:hypothetical protein
MHDLSHNAEVLVFEGVRYEKDMPTNAVHKKSKPKTPKVKIKS